MSVVHYLDPQTTFFWSTGVKSMKIFVRYLLFILPSFCCSIVVNQLIFVYTGHDAVGNADADGISETALDGIENVSFRGFLSTKSPKIDRKYILIYMSIL